MTIVIFASAMSHPPDSKRTLKHAHRPRFSRMATVDQALNHCANIRTLAHLLEASGSTGGAVCLEPEVVSNAGWLIKEEAACLRELVRQLRQPPLGNSRQRR